MERAMSDQEMQFADPDWKPTRPLNKSKAPQEQEIYTPQPINVEPQEQQRGQSSTPLPDYSDGYAGSSPQTPPAQKIEYAGTDSYNHAAQNSISGTSFRQQRARRRGRSPWLWIIVAIIIIVFMSGGFGSAFKAARPSFERGFGFQNSAQEIKKFTVGAQPTIIIHDASGDIRVHTGDSSSDSVTVQATKQADGFGNPNDEHVSYKPSPDGSSITINFTGQDGSVDFDVTVPSNSNLHLTSSGDITVDGINGQASLSADGDITATNDNFGGSTELVSSGGDITAKQDQLNGSTTLQASGDITFNGSINGSGTYQFTTNGGDIDATLSRNTALDINASTDNGSITSNVLTVQNNDPGATATGQIGASNPSSQLTLKTSDGSINLNTQP